MIIFLHIEQDFNGCQLSLKLSIVPYVRYTDSTLLISVCHLIHQLFLVLNTVIPPDLQNDLLMFVAAD